MDRKLNSILYRPIVYLLYSILGNALALYVTGQKQPNLEGTWSAGNGPRSPDEVPSPPDEGTRSTDERPRSPDEGPMYTNEGPFPPMKDRGQPLGTAVYP